MIGITENTHMIGKDSFVDILLQFDYKFTQTSNE